MILNGSEKSALLLMSIGSDQASEILKNLTPFEVKELVASMVNIKKCSTETLNNVLSECYNIAVKTNVFDHNNSDNYLIKMLTKALGEKKGNDFLHQALEVRNFKECISALNVMNPKKISIFLEKEHPQISAVILICLNKNQAGEILSFLNEDKRAQIILKITEFNGIEESTLIDLIKVINDLIKEKKLILANKGGIKTAVQILNTMDVKHENATIKKISILNKSVSNKIFKEIFSFNQILDLDDKHIKFIIKNVESEKIYIALQNTNFLIKQKFLRNMSEKDSHILLKSLEKNSYISNDAIKNEQKLILMMIKSVFNNKNISLEKLGKYYA